MAAIEHGVIFIDEVIVGDVFDISFDIDGVDLTGKTLQCDVFYNYRVAPILEYKESDNSLSKIVKSETLTSISLHKTSEEMKVTPGTYQIKLYAHSDLPDNVTVMVGKMTIIN